MSEPRGYNIRSFRPDDLPPVLNLLQASLAGGPTGERTAEFFRWKHLENPFGKSYALVAERAGEIVAFRTFMRWVFDLDGRPVKAVRAVDTATHPDHQGKGLFKRLTLTALDELREQAEFVFNTPNANSLPGYLKMGWEVVGTIPVMIRPVRLLRFMRGLGGASRGGGGSIPDPGLVPAARYTSDGATMAALLAERPPQAGRLATLRTPDYLHWRYGRAPALDYRAVVFGGVSGPRALGFGRLRSRGQLREFTLAEVLARADDDAAVGGVLRNAAKTPCDHVATHLGRSLHGTATRSGYLRLPGRGILLTIRDLDGTVHPRDAQAWSLMLGDLEVF